MEKIDFSNIKALVIGDIMLDVYYKGNVDRISPEAPVPVVRVNSVSYSLGGAANVCNNIANLGAKATLIGFTGNDDHESKISTLLEKSGIDAKLIKTASPTITKMRILGEHQQIVRVDFEDKNPNYQENDYSLLQQYILPELKDANIVIISDYKKGVVKESICKRIIEESKKLNKIVIVDPKGNNWEKYAGATYITPNLKELKDISNTDIKNENDDVVKSGSNIVGKFDLDNLLVTRSEKGMSLINKNETFHIPTNAKEVYDVSGAGDTVIATLSLGLASGMSNYEAIKLANTAAGIVVGKLGTVPITKDELEDTINYYENEKILPLNKLLSKLKSLKEKNHKIVFTNGCFDILHKGHINYMLKAKQLGDILIIGLNSDSSVKRLKGKTRPINNQDDRAILLSALGFVDFVVLFEEDTPFNLIREIRPDILVKGGDYKAEDVVGREFAGETVIIDFVDGYSTTNTLKKMNK